MPVEIVVDEATLLATSDFDCVVAVVADYVPAVQRLKQALHSGQPLRVLVRERTCAVWLARFAGMYHESQVSYQVTSARALLAQRWQTAIPESISDEAILAAGFLQADITPKSGQTYPEIVLAHYGGEFFTFAVFPQPLLAEALESLEDARWQANRTRPLVLQTLQERQRQWLAQAKAADQRELIAALFTDPQQLRERLGQYRLVRHYPETVGHAVLGPWYPRFNSLGIDPDAINVSDLNLGSAIQQIRYYLNAAAEQLTRGEDWAAIIAQMSGCLLEEFFWVRDQLQARQFSLSADLLQQITVRFQPIQDQIRADLESLALAVPPEVYPAAPDVNWGAAEWLRWAVQEYLPYRFWLEENNRWDETVAGYAAVYADWFFQHYLELKYQEQQHWVFAALQQLVPHLQQGHKVLLVIVDNFNFKYLSVLQQRFARQGFRSMGPVTPLWALLPTTTEVSKPCLVAGTPDLTKVQGSTYEVMLAQNWQSYFPGRRFGYLPKLGALQALQQFDGDVLVLNYLPIDEVLHKDEQQIGTTHTGEVRVQLEALVEAVCQFAKRAKVETNLVVAIVADHGSTKLLPQAESLLDDQFYKKQAQDRHHRYITVPSARATNPTAYDQAQCYILPAQAYGLRESYFIPRGYGVFIKTTESIYVHGGLTPEETIVPFVRLMKMAIKVVQPTFRLPANVIRYGVKVNLVLQVGNPNEVDLTQMELKIAESDLPGVPVALLPAGREIAVTVSLRVQRPTDGTLLTALTVQGAFDCQGEHFTLQPMQLPIVVRSLMESKTDFDF